MATPADAARDEILEILQPHLEKSGIRAVGPDVLICPYSRAGKKTAGGIIVLDNYEEDDFQGVTGLILSMGPLCKGSEFEEWFSGDPPKVHDWIGFSVKNGERFGMGGRVLRLIEWKYLRFPTLVPDLTM